METIRILCAVLFCLTTVRGAPFGDDAPSSTCYNKCDRLKACKNLERMPRKKVERCLDFLEDKCFKSKNPKKCLDSLKKTKNEGCTKIILKSALPCLKCEIDCDSDDYDYDYDYKISESEEKCYNQCDNSKACVAREAVPSANKDICEKYMKRMCGTDMEFVDCLEMLKNKENPKCPRKIRQKVLECTKCEDRCDDPDYDADHADDEECHDRCSATKSCQVFDAVTKNRMKNCKMLTQRKCPNDQDNIPKCLESIKDVNDIQCPKEFRSHALACMKCDFSCTDRPLTALPENRPNFEEDIEKCLDACDVTPECAVFDSTDDESEACVAFLSENCEEDDNATACMKKLVAPPASCPSNVLNNITTCLMCEDNCDESYESGESIGPEERACLDECAATASCEAMMSATDEALNRCELLFENVCGDSEDPDTCMEAYTEEDETCPIAFRSKINECMKCEGKCEGPPPPTSGAPPPLNGTTLPDGSPPTSYSTSTSTPSGLP